jgi:hypothetical protein
MRFIPNFIEITEDSNGARRVKWNSRKLKKPL